VTDASRRSDDDEDVAAASRREQLDELNSQAATVRADIDVIEQQREVDREVIAHLVADGVADQAKIANLEIALVSARRIGAAMGTLMGRHGLTDDPAFDRLRGNSQNTRRKLRDVAEDVLLTGTLD
jgi:ANTAR domain-containing protein